MTEQQKEYLITEDPISELQCELLEAFTTGNKDADGHALSVILSCFQQYMKKVHSRPHPAAAVPADKPVPYVECNHSYSSCPINWEAHNKAIAKQAIERDRKTRAAPAVPNSQELPAARGE